MEYFKERMQISPNLYLGFHFIYMILFGIISLFAAVDVPKVVSQPPMLMYTMEDLKPGTSYEVMISVIVNVNATIERFNSSYHQMKTLGYGPDNGETCHQNLTLKQPICYCRLQCVTIIIVCRLPPL